MQLYSWESAAALTLAVIPLIILAEITYRSLLRLPSVGNKGPLPSLSIIVPARNEITNLGSLMPTLASLCYDGPCEVIVVDDNSTDGTGAMAAAAGARVLSLTELPAGWKGKPNACHRGAAEARGDWLLFTDADTTHAPDGPARAVSLALREGLDGLSLLPPVRFFGFADRIALTAAFAGLFAMGAPKAAMLNGQFLLVLRRVYEDSGGFAAVRFEALEDVALGHRLAEMGYRVPMALSNGAFQVSMYSSLRQMWDGLTRLGQGALRWWGLRAGLSVLFITALMSPLIGLTGWILGELPIAWVAATWGVAGICMAPWARRAGHTLDAAFSPVGALIIMVAALWGLISRLLGLGVNWKGRRV